MESGENVGGHFREIFNLKLTWRERYFTVLLYHQIMPDFSCL